MSSEGPANTAFESIDPKQAPQTQNFIIYDVHTLYPDYYLKKLLLIQDSKVDIL